MTHEDLFFLMAVNSVSVTQKRNFCAFARETRPNQKFEEQQFKDVELHLSMYFSQSDIASFSAHVSLSLTSPVNAKWMYYDVVITRTVSDLLEISNLDYIKMLAIAAYNHFYLDIVETLEEQIKTKANTSKENAK